MQLSEKKEDRDQLVSLVENVCKNLMCNWGLKEPHPAHDLRENIRFSVQQYLQNGLAQGGFIERIRIDTGRLNAAREPQPTIEIWRAVQDAGASRSYEKYGTAGAGYRHGEYPCE